MNALVLSSRRLEDSGRLSDQLERLHRAAWALCRSPHDVDDLVQETLSRVLARPRRLRVGHELPYLLSALRNTYLNGLRTQQRRPCTVAMPADECEALHSGLAEPEPALEHQELYAAIAALPDGFREALIAVDVVGLSYREAGLLLGVPEATIASRLFRGRQGVAGALAA